MLAPKLHIEKLQERIEILEHENRQLKNKLELKDEIAKERGNLFEHILDNLPSDLVAFDKDQRYLYINPIAIKDPEIRSWMIGKTDFDYCEKRGRPISIAEGRKRMFQQLLQEKKEVSFEEKMISKDGKEVWNLRRMYPVLNQENEVLYVVGYANNITYLKDMEENLEREKIKSQVSHKAKQDFIANMSHEIRTPMNAIMGMSNLMRAAGLEGKYKEYLEAIQTSSQNLLVVINDILDFSKLNAGKVDLDLVPTCLKKQMDQLNTLFQVKSSSKDVLFEIEIDPLLQNTPLLLDPVRISQVMNNLVGNALKFTDQGTVKVELNVLEKSKKNYHIEFQVRDTGVGIPNDQIDRILSPFSQADTSTTRKYGGTGLGLAITNDLVSLMGGELKVVSQERKGSVFSFSFEAKVSEIQASCNQSIIESGQINLDGLRVLLVEDNPVNQLLASAVLEEFTEAFHLANNGQEAIDVLMSEKVFDVVLMDIQMPVMGGLECTDKIRNALGLDLPIIALTANAFKEDKDRYLNSGMNGYISKPFHVDDFKKVIFDVVNNLNNYKPYNYD